MTMPRQAKDIDTPEVIEFIREINEREDRWVLMGELCERFDAPWNLMRAKMKRLVEKPQDKRIVEGCACGCRGDFHIRGMKWG